MREVGSRNAVPEPGMCQFMDDNIDLRVNIPSSSERDVPQEILTRVLSPARRAKRKNSGRSS